MGIVIGMHAALLLVLARGFGLVPSLQLPKDITGVLIDKPEPADLPPPLPYYVPDQRQTVVLPAPDVAPIDFESSEGAITADLRPADEIPRTGSTVPIPVIQGVRTDPRRPLSQPPYDARAIREGHQGFVDVEIYVLPDGRVGEARILRSSGFERLDQATLEEARRHWRLLPATQDGTPIAQWHKLRVKFELKN
jgi:protein TonB